MKTETFNIIEYYELDNLIEQHLGIKVKEWQTQHGMVGDWDGCVNEMRWNNDTLNKVYLDYLLDESFNEEGAANTHVYIKKLCDLGVIPQDHDLLISVAW